MADWPQLSVIFCPTTRARMSVVPAGVYATMIRIGRAGKLSALVAALVRHGQTSVVAASRTTLVATFPLAIFISTTRSAPSRYLRGDARFAAGRCFGS